MPFKIAGFFKSSSRSPSLDGAASQGSVRRSALVQSGSRPGTRDNTGLVPLGFESSVNATALNRLSLKPKTTDPHAQDYPAALSVDMESPPLLFHGHSRESTGALMSGKLCLEVKVDDFVMKWLRLHFLVRTTFTKPFKKNCVECSRQTSQLDDWIMVASEVILPKGRSLDFSEYTSNPANL
jgi:hypothetical protein